MKDLVGKGRPCFDSEGEEAAGTNFYQCRQQVMAVWAVGGQGTTYPEDIGYPLYNEGKDMYVLMEMHYDNAQFKKGTSYIITLIWTGARFKCTVHTVRL